MSELKCLKARLVYRHEISDWFPSRAWSPTDSPVLIRAIPKLASIKRLCMWLWTDFPSLHSCVVTVVSRIYAPLFATLALVESVGGAYMRDLTFYLMNTPPLLGPRLRC